MYGTGEYGSSLFFGGTPYTAGPGPFVVSTDPAAGETGVSQSAPITITLDSVNVIDPLTVDLTIQGRQAIVGGMFQAGWAGTITNDGSQGVISVTSHPVFDSPVVDVLVCASDGSGILGKFTYSYIIDIESVGDLTATSWCEGKRIDLAWTNPSGVTQIRIYRSTYAFSNFETDPADLVYDGAPITTYSDTGLEEDKFYYYSVYLSYTAAAPYEFLINDDGKVAGLSIRDYFAEEGHYVYNLLPRTYRRRDAEPAREGDQYLLRRYCQFLQCGINVYRGWLESLQRLKDPENGPAGRLGVAENQRGILRGTSIDLGLDPEESYDAGVLRRIGVGIVPLVMKKKGTCPSLVNLCKILTTWDSRCVEAIEPICGINRLFRLYDGVSSRRFAFGTTHDPNISNGTVTLDCSTLGQVRVKKTHFFEPPYLLSSFDPANVVPNSLYLNSERGIRDATNVVPDNTELFPTWEDQSSKGNDATQATGLNQFYYYVPSTQGGFGHFELRPDIHNQGSSYMEAQGPGGTNFINGQSASFFFVVEGGFTAGESVLFSIETGPLQIKQRLAGGNQNYGFTDNVGEKDFGIARRIGPVALLFEFDADANTAYLWIDGVLEATATYDPPATLANDRVTIGDKPGGTGATFSKSYGEILAVDRVLLDSERKLLWSWAQLRYGGPAVGTSIALVQGIRPFGPTGTIPLSATGEPTVVSIISSLGDFACVETVTEDADEWIFDLEEAASYIRAEVTGTGAVVSGATFRIDSIDAVTYPWQFPSPSAEPVFEEGALVGKSVYFDGIGGLRQIMSNTATNAAGETTITVNIAPGGAPTAFAISDVYEGSYNNRIPFIKLTFLIGEFSFLVETLWDQRLLLETEKGPWSLLTGLGSTLAGKGFVPSPSDVTLFAKNQHEILGLADVVSDNSLQDTTQSWLVNQWAGYFLLPNWNQTKVYRIAGNTSDTLFVVVNGGGMDTVAELDSQYVILTEENAIKYRRLTKQLQSFIPHESRGFVKFEEDEAAFLASDFAATYGLGLWLKGTNGIVLDDSATPNTLNIWSNVGSLGNILDQTAPAGSGLAAPAGPTLDNINGVQAVEFGVAGAHYMTYSGAASDFAFLHDGQGCTIALVLEDSVSTTGHVFATCDGTATEIGVQLTRTTTDYRLRVCNGSGTYLVDLSVAVAFGTTAKILIRMKTTGVTNQVDFRVNGVSTTASFVGAPSASAPNDPLTLNDTPGAGLPFKGKNAEFFTYSSYVPDFVADRIDRGLAAQYG